MPIKKSDLKSKMKTKFLFEDVEGSKHEAVALTIDGKKVATMRFSRNQIEIKDPILGLMAKEIWVQLNYFKKMYECTISRDDYLNHLRSNGNLT